jgi:hypothetical protein
MIRSIVTAQSKDEELFLNLSADEISFRYGIQLDYVAPVFSPNVQLTGTCRLVVEDPVVIRNKFPVQDGIV